VLARTSTGEVTDSRRESRNNAIKVVLAMALVMWLAEIFDAVASNDLDRYGIQPRDADGLVGIPASPFLHSGFDHLISNTVPFLILGCVIALNGLLRVLAVTAIVALVGGLGTWLVAPGDTIHIGASGIVFGYATYLIVRGVFDRSALELALGVIVALVLGGTLLTGLVPHTGISWQGHLFGALGGIVAARVLAPKRPAAAGRPASL